MFKISSSVHSKGRSGFKGIYAIEKRFFAKPRYKTSISKTLCKSPGNKSSGDYVQSFFCSYWFEFNEYSTIKRRWFQPCRLLNSHQKGVCKKVPQLVSLVFSFKLIFMSNICLLYHFSNIMKTDFFLTLPLKKSEMICLNLGVSLHVLYGKNTNASFIKHMLWVF